MGINHKRNDGATLIELMIYICIVAIATQAFYTVMDSMRKATSAETQLVNMEQNIRAAMYYMEREIRLAGYPASSQFTFNKGPVPDTGIREAGPGRIRIAMDLFDGIDNDFDGEIDEWDEDATAPPAQSFNDGSVAVAGVLNEDITFGFAPAYDADQNGVVDGVPPVGTDPGAAPLGRADRNDAPGVGVGGYIDLAESIEAIGFAYAFDSDGDNMLDVADVNGNGTQDPDEPVIWAVDTDADGDLDTNLDTGGPTGIPPAPGGPPDGLVDTFDIVGGAPLNPNIPITQIRAVQVWILARSKHPISGFTENRTFVVGDKHIMPNDHYRRRLIHTVIRCRNL